MIGLCTFRDTPGSTTGLTASHAAPYIWRVTSVSSTRKRHAAPSCDAFCTKQIQSLVEHKLNTLWLHTIWNGLNQCSCAYTLAALMTNVHPWSVTSGAMPECTMQPQAEASAVLVAQHVQDWLRPCCSMDL